MLDTGDHGLGSFPTILTRTYTTFNVNGWDELISIDDNIVMTEVTPVAKVSSPSLH